MLRFTPAIAWFIFITYLFLLPGSQLPQETWFEKIYLDKWAHTGFFFILVFLFYFPLRIKTKKWLVRLVMVGLIYGIAIEFIQRYCTTDRNFDLLDIVFDGVGCGIAYLLGIRHAKK